MDIVRLSRKLMQEQTGKNKSPAWLLTEIAVKKGEELSRRYIVDEKIVVTSLYLAHIVFSPEWQDNTQKNHPELSSNFAKPYLKKWKVSAFNQGMILNSIEAHHNKVPCQTKTAEVVKNAECFKFVTVEGCSIYLHELGLRGINFHEAVERVIKKMKQKKSLITLKDCKKEAEKNCKDISKLFNSLEKM